MKKHFNFLLIALMAILVAAPAGAWDLGNPLVFLGGKTAINDQVSIAPVAPFAPISDLDKLAAEAADLESKAIALETTVGKATADDVAEAEAMAKATEAMAKNLEVRISASNANSVLILEARARVEEARQRIIIAKTKNEKILVLRKKIAIKRIQIAKKNLRAQDSSNFGNFGDFSNPIGQAELTISNIREELSMTPTGNKSVDRVVNTLLANYGKALVESKKSNKGGNGFKMDTVRVLKRFVGTYGAGNPDVIAALYLLADEQGLSDLQLAEVIHEQAGRTYQNRAAGIFRGDAEKGIFHTGVKGKRTLNGIRVAMQAEVDIDNQLTFRLTAKPIKKGKAYRIDIRAWRDLTENPNHPAKSRIGEFDYDFSPEGEVSVTTADGSRYIMIAGYQPAITGNLDGSISIAGNLVLEVKPPVVYTYTTTGKHHVSGPLNKKKMEGFFLPRTRDRHNVVSAKKIQKAFGLNPR